MENKEHRSGSLGILKCMFYSKAFNELEPHEWSILIGLRLFPLKESCSNSSAYCIQDTVNVNRRWWKNVFGGRGIAAAEKNVLLKVCKVCCMILIFVLSYSWYQTFISERIFFLSPLMIIPLPKVSKDFEVLLKGRRVNWFLESKYLFLTESK